VRVLAFAALGLLFGSFVTVLVHRLPRKESVVGPRSRCPRCGTLIRAVDNVPLVSYLLLRGRCRSCGARISAEYPLTELATAILFAGAGLVIRPVWAAAIVAPFLGVMLAVALIDLRWRIVPNRLIYPAVLVFLLALPAGMGMGDVKLAALIGLVLGSLGLAYVAVAAFAGVVGGGVGAVLAMSAMGYGRKQTIPFGPFLAAGAVVAALAAPQIAGMYLSLLG
jgi:leader peptidase (prepilin peptidase) / N-methyltransferase